MHKPTEIFCRYTIDVKKDTDLVNHNICNNINNHKKNYVYIKKLKHIKKIETKQLNIFV